jgi:hypothetical protein
MKMRKQYYAIVICISIMILPVPSFCLEFVDVTAKAGVFGTGIGNGVAFIDFDNDGNLDLYVSSDPQDILYHNNGDGTFDDVTAKSGIEVLGDGIGIAFGDYDNDGDPDIYIPVNDGLDIFYQNEGGNLFRDITGASRIDNPSRARGASFADFNLDGLLDICVINEGAPIILYRNKNGRFFEDVTNQVGLANNGPGRCCIWGDYDNDGDQDIYVTNKGIPNKLYRNDVIGFKDVTDIAGVEGSGDSTGSAFADYDNDGNLDLFVGGNKTCFLYHNNGDGTFSNVADIAGIVNPGEACTPTFADFDNDGDLDLYLSVWKGKSILYSNNGDGTFTDITEQVGMGAVGNGWSATAGDYDNDGNIDIYASYTTRSNILYKNMGNDNNWLYVKALGSLSNASGIGVRISVTANNLTQIREISGGTGYGSQDSLIAEFGLGKAQNIDRVDVFWSSGIHTTMRNVNPNQTIIAEEGFSAVEESESYNAKPKPNDQGKTTLIQNYPNPFNPGTWIPFQIANAGNVQISIYNSIGMLIREIDIGYKKPGTYIAKSDCVFWDGRDNQGELVSTGVYFYKLTTDKTTDIRKMILKK